MGIHKSVNNNAMRSEFDIFPSAIWFENSLNYWIHLLNLKDNIFAVKSYKDSILHVLVFN